MAIPQFQHSDIAARPRTPAKSETALALHADNPQNAPASVELQRRGDIEDASKSTCCANRRDNDERADSGSMMPEARPHTQFKENAAADNPRGGVDAFTEVSTGKEPTAANYEDRYPIIAKHWGVTSC